MRIVCRQTILIKYHSLFLSKARKDVTKFVVCCSCDWRFKGLVQFIKQTWKSTYPKATVLLLYLIINGCKIPLKIIEDLK